MKKVLLIFNILTTIAIFSASAADLNPFAYGLKSEYNENTLTLTVNFTLNAPASYVKLAISDGANDVWTKEYLASSYQSGKVPKATYTESIDVSDLPQGVDLTWRVDVTGFTPSSDVQYVDNSVKTYFPSSIDVDNNPENENFGTVFFVECMPTAMNNDTYSNYISYADGVGLYVLNADGSARRMPNQGDKVRYGYNGGRAKQTRSYFNGSERSGFSPYRVRVSDCGRIFVSSMTPDGEVLWEADPLVFSRPDAPDWQARAEAGWTRVLSALNDNTYMATEKRTCSHTYCGIYGIYTENTNKFMAGPNLGFDVRGAGKDLQLLMLSGCKEAIVQYTKEHFYCSEYNLGEAKLWTTEPSKRFFAGYVVNYAGVQVQYDKDGNVWMCQHRGGTDAETLMKFNRTGAVGSNVDYKEDPRVPYHRCGAIRFNHDFTQVAIASVGSGSGGAMTIYPVLANGMPDWKNGQEIDTKSITHHSMMDIAWDYANNLYIAADESNGSAGDCIAVYSVAHPTNNRVVSTPAASKYTFRVNCQPGVYHTVTMVSDPDDGGSITCMQGGSARTPGVLTVESCTELTLTAIPAAGHKFVNWTDDEDNVVSTTPEYTFYVTDEIKLIANFEYATYSGIVWKNLFIGGEANDIAAESADFPKTNERLWRLFQVEFNKYCAANSITTRNDRPNHVSSNVVSSCKGKKTQLNVTGFIGDITNAKNFFASNSLFAWMKDYMKLHSHNNLSGTTYKSPWIYYPYLFINRTDTAINWGLKSDGVTYIGDLSNWAFNGTNCAQTTYGNTTIAWDSFIQYGQPQYWRPYWAEHACGLKATMTYDEYMPTVTTWKRPASIATADDYITKIGTSTNVYPIRDWYKWNVPANDESIKDVAYQKYFILAWRKGSPTADEIVHHIYESNMELHASYVLKNIDENDNVDPTKNDASNDDVIKLLQNRHWVGLNPDTTVQPTHTLTVTRKLRAGMYNTICLPFGVNLEGLQDNNEYHHPLKDAEAWEFAGTTTSTYNESGDPVTVLNFNRVTVLEAGKPYLIKLKGNEDVTTDMTFSTVSSKPYVYPQKGGGIIFTPTISPTTVPKGSLILVENGRLAETTSDGQMLGMRAYFQIDELDPLTANEIRQRAAEGRLYFSFKKPVTTSVPVAPESEQQHKPEVRKIMYDGKIYILRGEEVYTITGHRVR